MSDARKAVAFERIGAEDVTYAYDNTIVYLSTAPGGSVSVGKAVTLTGNKTVGLSGDADPVEGKLIKVEQDGFCTVQVDGFCDLPQGDGAACVVKGKIVGALTGAAKGFIRLADITSLAETYHADGEVIDATVPAAIVVDL